MRVEELVLAHRRDAPRVEVLVRFETGEAGDVADVRQDGRLLEGVDDLFDQRIVAIHLCGDELVLPEASLADHVRRQGERAVDGTEVVPWEQVVDDDMADRTRARKRVD